MASNVLVCERVVQATYAAQIFPGATNSIRIIAMQDPDRNHEPFIPVATHRFGATGTEPADNWAKGGLIAEVDLETGRLAKGVKDPALTGGKLVYHSHHPDTDVPIEGVTVPRWLEIRDAMLRTAGALGFLKYVGWDVVVGEEEFWVLEGNAPASLAIQIHRPFLADPRAKRFFEYHGVV